MSRVVPAFAIGVAALLTFGCAADAPPEPEARRVAPAQARIVIKTRTCETKVELENICHVAKNCPEIGNCAEAYYRLLTCGHKWLDGAPRNGVPCGRLCGKTPEARDRQIAQDGGPFSPKSRQIGVRLCTPPV